jgi:hypothetical protein
MFLAAKEFQIGRPQILAGLMLLGFLAQSLWVATERKLSDLEYRYIASGLSREAGQEYRANSPLTGWVAAAPVHAIRMAKAVAPASMSSSLAIPRPWLIRLPFVLFGLWLGGALWWVARRLFDNAGGYVALALYCSSPAMVMISSNVGPEIILAWSSFGLIYTAIGVAHTLYAPPRKWAPRIVILGLAIGFALSAALWSFTLVLPAAAFMFYLAPGRRRSVVVVLLGACLVGMMVAAFFYGQAGSMAAGPITWLKPQLGQKFLKSLPFVLADSYPLFAMFLAALAVYGSWRRARYFGNSAPLITAFVVVLLFALVLAGNIWTATLGLSFAFVFIGGIAADLLETPARASLLAILIATILFRLVLGTKILASWIGPNHL